jgi:predicted neuraminidase
MLFFALAPALDVPAQETAGGLDKQPGAVLREFLYEKAPFPQCHASTLAETKSGLVAAWFGGTRERAPDVGIWLARHGKGGWSQPVEVANGVQNDDTRQPCWNPVLFQPRSGPLLLFYKVGPSPGRWWCMLMTSDDDGRTWSKPRRMPDGVIGPVRNKPLQLPNGDLLCPSSTEHQGWRVHFDRTPDLGKTWKPAEAIHDGKDFAAIQPAILVHPGGRLQALCRSKQGAIVSTESTDGGNTWSKLSATMLPNNSSGIDAVTLKDGRHLLVYNHTKKGRTPLNVAVSKDGRQWQAALVLENEPGEYSYPCALQTSDGLVHITYTWRRQRVRHVVIDPMRLQLRDFMDGEWPR